MALCGDSESVGLAQMSELQMQHLSVVSNGGPTVSAGGRMRGQERGGFKKCSSETPLRA